MDVRTIVLVVLKGIDAHVTVVVERGVVAVAFVEVDVTYRQFGIIHAADIHIIGADRFHRVGIDAVNMDRIAWIQVAVHVVVKVPNDIHAFLLATRGIGLTTIKPHFLAAVSAIDDAILKLILCHDSSAFQHTGYACGIVVGTRSQTATKS